jgi:hypothetical protein
VAFVDMERGNLIQHLEGTIICEESSTNVNSNRVILDVYPMMRGEKKKVEKLLANANKSREEANIVRNIIAKKISVFGTLITRRIN